MAACVEVAKIYFSPSSSSSSSPSAAAAAVAGLQPGSDEWVRIRGEVWRAMESHGCFEAVFPELFPGDIRPAMFSAAKEIFDLPRETKMRVSVDEYGYGYVWYSQSEIMGFKDAMNLASIQSFSKTLWPPHGHPSFCETAHATVKQVSKLEHVAWKMIMESLGVEKYYDEEDVDSTYYLFRMIKYGKLETKEAGQVLPHHTDASLLTILFQNNVSGLEVQAKNGDWLPVLTIPNSFVVMAGDSLTAYSNGRIVAPNHRVVMKGDEERYSMGLFVVAKSGHTVQAPQELIDDEHPLLFKSYDPFKYLTFRFDPASYALECPLKTFCGI